jgi:hypothetical protein
MAMKRLLNGFGQISHDMEGKCTSKHEEESKHFLEQILLLRKHSVYQV